MVDITPAQANVLMLLFQAKRDMTAREITTALGVTEATVSRFVKTLLAKDWVARQRCTIDARVWWIRPTAKARTHLPLFIQVTNGLFDCAFSGLGRADIERLLGLVGQITRNIDAG